MHAANDRRTTLPAIEMLPRPDWRWAFTWSLVILAVSCLPYLVAWAFTPPGYHFTGILINPLDGHSYLAKMRQGWDGHWLFHLTTTPEAHIGAAVYTHYLALGHVARLIGLPLVAVYHAARVAGGLALLLILYAFCCRISPIPRERHLLFALAGTTAGLGWLGALVGLLPIDLWVPEAFAFFSLLSNPHFPLALAFILAIVYLVVWPARGARRWLLPALCGAALGMLAPFALAVLYATLALYVVLLMWLARRAPAGAAGARAQVLPAVFAAASAVVASLPWLVYDAWVFSTNPAFIAWSAQNVTHTPSLPNVVVGFGLLGPLAVVGAVDAVRRRDASALALVLWAGITLVLLNAPLALQRRMITGLGLPVALLAGIGLARWRPRRPSTADTDDDPAPALLVPQYSMGRLAYVALVVGLLGSLVLLVAYPAGALGKVITGDVSALSYLADDEVSAMQWLDQNARGAVILASPRSGAVLPGQASVRVFYGHPFETLDAANKQAQAAAFFNGNLSPEEWRAMVAANAIDYVYVGPAELSMGPVRLPDGLDRVFQHGDATIYRVRHSES